ncbi:DNA-binding transcriptional regulator, AcrR family [Salinihabitans flavidus]|uniref:DNA-binding transcriptional regulator, AcrR family n=1 Tax=Salinihabitans flavidus TaxID=569882 RepID=A0A1H8WD26_9RHOB|nr:TetR/AcrR family transcriptional regulator [Salinihabitans flavidus]SEP25546.1 DNA-binding transcriptional regulator, AcrR family [Salinihabitans flavidus]
MTENIEDPVTDGRVLRGEATRERVLDAAERLFAAEGFDAISIRRIAAEAGVTLGVVSFHGGTKHQLFATVIERRVAALNADRRARLGVLLSGDKPPELRDLVDAYLTPYLTHASRGDPQWRAYARLIARIVSDDRWYPEIGNFYDPVAQEFLDAIQSARPATPRKELVTALTLTVAAMLSLVASRARIAGLSGDPAGEPLAYRETLITFCLGGFDAISRES